jgi:hypothetical protein
MRYLFIFCIIPIILYASYQYKKNDVAQFSINSIKYNKKQDIMILEIKESISKRIYVYKFENNMSNHHLNCIENDIVRFIVFNLPVDEINLVEKNE